MRKVALPCGIVGGIWGVLAAVLVLLPITARVAVSPITGEQGGKEMVSMLEMGMALNALPFLGFIALMGMLGLLAIVLRKKRLSLAKPLLWTSALGILVVSLVSIFSLGLFFLPASVLLLVATFGLKGEVV